ncbi:WD40 domain-containing protein [Streptomyces wedmorensis]
MRRRLWLKRIVVAASAGGLVYLAVTAWRDGWGNADPVASVMGGGGALIAVLLSLTGTGETAEPSSQRLRLVHPVPDGWVDRDEAARVIAALKKRTRWRWRGGDTVAITAGLHGAGGYGKTALARYVASQPSIQRWFPGGTWVITIGRDVRSRDAIAAKVAAETRRITGDTAEAGDDPEQAGSRFGALLAQRPRTLLIIDDVWDASQLKPFLIGAERKCVRLVTTRNPTALPPQATQIIVDRMTDEQSRAVLTRNLPQLPDESAIGHLVESTGGWVLLLRIANRVLHDQIGTGADATDAARRLLRNLEMHGPAAHDPHDVLDVEEVDQRSTAVRASLRAATTLLPTHGEERFTELGIFAEDEAIPVELVGHLWQGTASLDEHATRELCKRMADLSLLRIETNTPGGTITIHDVIRDHLRVQLGSRLPSVNASFLDSLARAGQDAAGWWSTPHGYLQDHLIDHLVAAGRTAEAATVACDFRWVSMRLHQHGPTAPLRDLALIPTPTASALAGQLARTAHLLTPTTRRQSLQAVLHSRVVTTRPAWHLVGRAALERPALINRWTPPDLPTAALLQVFRFDESPDGVGPDGLHVIATSDSTVSIWDTTTGRALDLQHHSRIGTVRFSPDSTRLAVSCQDGTVSLWDTATGRTVHHLRLHRPASRLRFAPDGTLLATVGFGRRVSLWDTTTGREVHRLVHSDVVAKVEFSPDGTTLVTSCHDKEVRLWDTADGRELHRLRHDAGPPYDGTELAVLVFSPDATRLATAGLNDRTVRIWDVATGREVHRLVHGDSVAKVAFSQDGTRLATTGASNLMVQLWDSCTGVELHRLHHGDMVRNMVFASDGSFLATSCADNAVRLWDSSAGHELHCLRHNDRALYSMAFSPDDSHLVTTGSDRTARVWDSSSGIEVHRLHHQNAVRTVAFNHDGTRLVTTCFDESARVWDLQAVSPPRSLADFAVLDASMSPDGTRLATVGDDKVIRVWDSATGVDLLSHHHGDMLGDVAFSPDGSRLATRCADNTVRLWDSSTGNELHCFSHDGGVLALAFSSDGTRLATSCQNRGARIWDSDTGQEIHRLHHDARVTAMTFSTDDTRLATVGTDRAVRVWNTHTGREVQRFQHQGRIHAVVFSPDGNHLATNRFARTHVWNLETGHQLFSLHHENRVSSVAFSPHGDRIATSCEDGTARMWDSSTGREVHRLHHDASVTTVAFSPNGNHLATLSSGNEVGVWSTDGGEPIAVMRADDSLRSCVWHPSGDAIFVAGRVLLGYDLLL